jgi:hypothetical protein
MAKNPALFKSQLSNSYNNFTRVGEETGCNSVKRDNFRKIHGFLWKIGESFGIIQGDSAGQLMERVFVAVFRRRFVMWDKQSSKNTRRLTTQ